MTFLKGLRYAIIRLLSPKVRNLLDPQYRATIDAVKRKFKGKPLIGAEIGVAAGKNAHNFEHKFPGVIGAVFKFASGQDVEFNVFKVDWWVQK